MKKALIVLLCVILFCLGIFFGINKVTNSKFVRPEVCVNGVLYISNGKCPAKKIENAELLGKIDKKSAENEHPDESFESNFSEYLDKEVFKTADGPLYLKLKSDKVMLLTPDKF